jgi:L-fuculose-phosphate aldolase
VTATTARAESSAAVRAGLCEAYRSLGRLGLIQGSSGNISVHTPDGMLISPTRMTADRIEPADLVAMPLHEPAPGASSEWALHAAVYDGDAGLGAVVHTHADACTALACLGEPLPPFHYMVASFGGDDVRCAPYATFGTPALAAVAAEAMRDRTACLLANHGMIAAGPTLDAAIAATLRLETLARQYLLARAAGPLRLLTPAQMADARERFLTY